MKKFILTLLACNLLLALPVHAADIDVDNLTASTGTFSNTVFINHPAPALGGAVLNVNKSSDVASGVNLGAKIFTSAKPISDSSASQTSLFVGLDFNKYSPFNFSGTTNAALLVNAEGGAKGADYQTPIAGGVFRATARHGNYKELTALRAEVYPDGDATGVGGGIVIPSFGGVEGYLDDSFGLRVYEPYPNVVLPEGKKQRTLEVMGGLSTFNGQVTIGATSTPVGTLDVVGSLCLISGTSDPVCLSADELGTLKRIINFVDRILELFN